MLPILQVGPLAIQTPGLVLLLGLWIGLSLSERHAPRHGVDAGRLYNLVLIAILSGIAGGRLVFAGMYPGAFAGSPLNLISINPGLFDLWGGATIGAMAALIYANRKAMSLLPTFDALSPLLAVMAVAVGLANLASGSAFGAPADLPWAIELWGARRHPAQIYETLAALVILALIWFGYNQGVFAAPGSRFLSFLALSAAARLFFEALRGDSVLLPGGIRLAQIAAWAVLAFSLWSLGKLRSTTAGPTQESGEERRGETA